MLCALIAGGRVAEAGVSWSIGKLAKWGGTDCSRLPFFISASISVGHHLRFNFSVLSYALRYLYATSSTRHHLRVVYRFVTSPSSHHRQPVIGSLSSVCYVIGSSSSAVRHLYATSTARHHLHVIIGSSSPVRNITGASSSLRDIIIFISGSPSPIW